MAQHPVARLQLTSLGPFGHLDVDWSPGLNVIIGDNATGKSQLLKVLYSSTKAVRAAKALTKKDLNADLADKLIGTLRPDSLGRLTRRIRGRSSAKVGVKFAGIGEPLSYGFSSHAKREVVVESVPNRPLQDEPVYLPPHELLTLSAAFLSLYDNLESGFDETWRDTTELLIRPALRGPRMMSANAMMRPFSELLLGGSVFDDGGRFYLHQPGIGNLEAPLLAEGHRKLAMIVRLISNGVLLEGGYLFWDEPEANLNPASQRAVSSALLHLVRAGAQVFVATHSMFLMRELQMASAALRPRFVGLTRNRTEGGKIALAEVRAQSADDLDDIEYVAALAAESDQAQRYLAW